MEEVKKTEICKNCKHFNPDKGQFYIGDYEYLDVVRTISFRLCNDSCIYFFEEKDS